MYIPFMKRVLHVKIYGPINSQTAVQLHRSLKNKNLYNVQMIAVSINSTGGSLIQAKNICTALKLFSEKTQAPIYTFAEDVVFNSANLILASGNKAFAGKYSLVGDFGYSYQGLGFKDFLEKYNLNAQFIHAGEKKVKLNPTKPMSQEDAEWMKDLLVRKEQELQNAVIAQRTGIFNDLRLTNEDVNVNLLKKGMLDAEQALSTGLIDGINTFENVANEKYNGVKVVDVLPTGSFLNYILKSTTFFGSIAT